MTALTAPSTVASKLSRPNETVDMQPVDISTNTGGGLIYAMGMIGLNGSTGYVRRWQSGDSFVGVALRNADNSGTGTPLGKNTGTVGDGTAGGLKVPVLAKGLLLWRSTITGVTADVTAADTVVYCSDDATLTSSSGGGNAKIGVIRRYDTDLGGFLIEINSKIDKDATS